VDSAGLSFQAQGPGAGPGQRRRLRRLSADSFAAGETLLTFLREGGRVVKLRFDEVSIVSTLDRQP
jgi:hypothetical protein